MLLGICFLALSSTFTEAGTDCSVGVRCKLVGTAVIYPRADGEDATLEVGDKCFALALPEDSYEDIKSRWNGRRVTVEGLAYRQPEGNFLYYKIRGRQVSTGCRGLGILLIKLDGAT